MKTINYFTLNGTLAQLIMFHNNYYHVYFDSNLNIIHVEKQWYNVKENLEAVKQLVTRVVTVEEILDFYKDCHVYGNIYKNVDGTYTVLSWDNTCIIGEFSLLTEAKLSLIDCIASKYEMENDWGKLTPFNELRVILPKRIAGVLNNFVIEVV